MELLEAIGKENAQQILTWLDETKDQFLTSSEIKTIKLAGSNVFHVYNYARIRDKFFGFSIDQRDPPAQLPTSEAVMKFLQSIGFHEILGKSRPYFKDDVVAGFDFATRHDIRIILNDALQ